MRNRLIDLTKNEYAAHLLDQRQILKISDDVLRQSTSAADVQVWLAAIIGTTRVSRLLQFFQTRVLREDDAGVRIANLADTIDVASALEMSDRFLELPLDVRSTYSRAPVSTRGPGLGVLARWGEQHAADGVVSGAELTTPGSSRDRLLLYEDRSRMATLYLWLAQRFPKVYVNAFEVMRVREALDDDIHDALLQHGAQPKRDRKIVPFARPKGPPKFNKRRLPK